LVDVNLSFRSSYNSPDSQPDSLPERERGFTDSGILVMERYKALFTGFENGDSGLILGEGG